jgi:prolyl-tRNA synthetase
MRASRMNLATLREDPAEAEIASHRLLTRAGFLHKSGSGLYLYQPLLKRVIDKISRIVAEEISKAGGLEITMPILQEQELWEKSGRWAQYQASRTMLTVKDRNGQLFGLAPTAEEVVTDYAACVVKSYKQLPACFFQQNTKFRDEIRPRFGLMRVKEFIMMDAYSFHASPACLDTTYETMRVAYLRAFARLGLTAFAVEADTGAIGGSGSHEFMVAAEVGEDAIIYNPASGYAANVERATGIIPKPAAWTAPAAAALTLTPQVGSIADVMGLLNANGFPDVKAEHGLKCVLFVITVKTPTLEKTIRTAAFVRGDREVNEVKLGNAVARGARGALLDMRPMHPDEVRACTRAEPGFAGPGEGLSVDFCFIDASLKEVGPLVAGANQTDHHLVGFVIERDAKVQFRWEDIVSTRAGDLDVRGGVLSERRGIEVGHIFKLGTKYSAAMKAEFLGPDQKVHPFVMGCYGIGTSRVAAAAVEQHNDADGLRWPVSIAPYHCVVIPAGKPGDTAVEQAAQDIYLKLQKAGIEVVIDDRDAKPGVKFKDWDLIGIPLRVVCGRGIAEGKIEFKVRGGASQDVAIDDAAATVIEAFVKATETLENAADAVT